MFAPWRSYNPVLITKSHITGKSFIVVIVAENSKFHRFRVSFDTVQYRKRSPAWTANDPKGNVGMAWTQVSGSSGKFYRYYKK